MNIRLSTMRIERSFLRRRKYFFLGGIVGLIVGYFILMHVNEIVGAFMMVISARFIFLLTDYGEHKDLLKWMDAHEGIRIFIFDPRKKKNGDFVKQHVLTLIDQNVLVGHKSGWFPDGGTLPAQVLQGLNDYQKIRELPVMITLDKGQMSYHYLKEAVSDFQAGIITKQAFYRTINSI